MFVCQPTESCVIKKRDYNRTYSHIINSSPTILYYLMLGAGQDVQNITIVEIFEKDCLIWD